MYLTGVSTLSDTGSTFTQNVAFEGGAIYLDRSTLNLESTVFYLNYATSGGAVIFTSESTSTTVTNANFTENYASSEGGAISVLSTSTLKITSGTFKSNTSPDSSAIYTLGTDGENQINGTTFESNTASVGRTISFLFASSQLVSCSFKDNSAVKETEGIFITFSTVNVLSSTFENSVSLYDSDDPSSTESTSVAGGYIYVSVGVTLTVTSSTFTRGNAYSGGSIYMSGNSDIQVSSCTFTENYSETQGGSIYLSNYNTFVLQSSNFTQGIAKTGGSEIYSSSGTISISDCKFTLTPTKVAIYFLSTSFTGSTITMTNSNTTNTAKTATNGGGIYSKNSGSFVLTDSTFTSINYAEYGGSMYLESDTQSSIPTEASHSITNVTFSSNSAYHGGALYIKEIDYLSISNATFSSNSATSSTSVDGKGGAIYYYSSSKGDNLIFSIFFTSFIRVKLNYFV
jgi:predicted outer membrane repeat protein